MKYLPMNHLYYPKIVTSLAKTPLPPSQQWVATEKIHGAQFVIGINERGIRYGKRKAWLRDDEPFFGWQMLRRIFEASAHTLYAACRDISALYLYGELFGGAYPHEDVPRVTLLRPVQTGVWYAPTLHYAVFDMLIVRDETPRFLPFSEVEMLVAETELLTPPVLGYGSYASLQAHPARYASKVHAMLGLPAIAGNDAEGFVLKPDCEMAAHARPAVKYKIPEFSETRFDESRAFDAQSLPDVEELLELVNLMVNRARIESARSKAGEELEAVIAESVLDVPIDLESIFPRKMALLTEREEQHLTQAIEKDVKDYLNTAFS